MRTKGALIASVALCVGPVQAHSATKVWLGYADKITAALFELDISKLNDNASTSNQK